MIRSPTVPRAEMFTRSAFAFVVVTIALALAPRVAVAQPAAAPPPSGQYEAWSPVRMAPVGPLAAAAPAPLPRWLSVTTTGAECTITFEPDRRVVWRVRYGPHGPVEKVTEVDGQPFSRTTFTYDAAGHLATKRVEGPGITAGPWLAAYRTDPATGRVLARTEQLVLRNTWGSRNLPSPSLPARWEVTYGRSGAAEARQFVGAELVRLDAFDAAGRLVRTEFRSTSGLALSPAARPRTAPRPIVLHYVRDSAGALTRIDRELDGRRGATNPTTPTPALRLQHVTRFSHSLAERHEVLLALGAPAHATDQDRGAARRMTDDFAPACDLNTSSGLEYDATGLVVAPFATCICGFCVAAELPVDARDATALDLHWTAGPWVRLDDAVDVTADHRVMTPRGPRPAGELRAGDAVLAGDGTPRVLRSVARLPAGGGARLGRNVRTPRGVFEAGGILFESEAPRACAPSATP